MRACEKVLWSSNNIIFKHLFSIVVIQSFWENFNPEEVIWTIQVEWIWKKSWIHSGQRSQVSALKKEDQNEGRWWFQFKMNKSYDKYSEREIYQYLKRNVK